MLKFKPTSKSDLQAIAQMNKDYGFTFVPGELSLNDGVILDAKNEVIAFGMVKPLAEAIFITDKKLPKVTRAHAMKMLMDIAIKSSKEFGARQLHTFVVDQKLARSLEKHYEFEVVNDIVLVKNL